MTEAEEKSGYHYTILVIDDEPDTREFLELVFKGQNCRVHWAKDGAQGLRLAASELPDIVVLDLNMPGMEGQEVCRRLREQEKTFALPILVLTGDARAQQEASCLGLGADDFLVKMPSPLRLQARIKRMIQRYRLRTGPDGVLRMGDISLGMRTHHLRLPGRTDVVLTPTESALCALLMSAGGKPVEQRVIFKKLYNSWPDASSDKLRKHVSNLKQKLGSCSDLIEAVRGEGYRFNADCVSPETKEPSLGQA